MPDWDERSYVVYQQDSTRAVAADGTILIIELYKKFGVDDPRCLEAHGGGTCCRTRDHQDEHVSCSSEIAGLGVHFTRRLVPE